MLDIHSTIRHLILFAEDLKMESDKTPTPNNSTTPNQTHHSESSSHIQHLSHSESKSFECGVNEVASTHCLTHQQAPIRVNQGQRVDEKVLEGTGLTQNMRARMRTYLMRECTKQHIMRETCVLACHYIDIFLMRGGRIEPAKMEDQTIGCLMLALKICEGRFPQNLFRNFNLADLRATELKITLKVDFKLNPPTYYTLAERLTYLWHWWPSRHPYSSFINPPQTPNLKLRALYEQLDLAFLVIKSLSFSFQQITATLFFLRVAILNGHLASNCHELPPEQFKVIFSQSNSFRSLFDSFLSSHLESVRVSENAGLLLKNFIGVKSEAKAQKLVASEVVKHLREWDRIQTCPKGSYVLAKQVSACLSRQASPNVQGQK